MYHIITGTYTQTLTSLIITSHTCRGEIYLPGSSSLSAFIKVSLFYLAKTDVSQLYLALRPPNEVEIIILPNGKISGEYIL